MYNICHGAPWYYVFLSFCLEEAKTTNSINHFFVFQLAIYRDFVFGLAALQVKTSPGTNQPP